MGAVVEMEMEKWAGLKRDVDAMEKHKSTYRSYWKTIARRMADLREAFPSNEAFGSELVSHGIEMNRDDRAAFIEMGKWSDAYFADMMALIDRNSPRYFVADAKEFGPAKYRRDAVIANSEDGPTCTTETGKQPESAPEPGVFEEATAEKSGADVEVADKASRKKPTINDKRQRIDEFFSSVSQWNGKPHASKMSDDAVKALYDILVEDGAPPRFAGGTMAKFSVRIFCVDAPIGLTKETSADWYAKGKAAAEHIRKVGRYALEAYKAGIEPDQLAMWWHRHVKIGTPTSASTSAPVELAPNVTAYRVNGKQVWPTFVPGLDDPASQQANAENAIAFWARLQNELMTSAGKDEKSAAQIISQLRGLGKTSFTPLADAVIHSCISATLHPDNPGDTVLPNTQAVWSRNIHKK